MMTLQTFPAAPTYRESLVAREEFIWQNLGKITVRQAVESWLNSIESHNTRASYSYGFLKLESIGIINGYESLQVLANWPGNALLDRIKLIDGWSEATKQARAAALLSFYRYLSRRTDGMIKRIEPSREGINMTFFKIRDIVATEALNPAQWTKWLIELEKIDEKYVLIAKLALQGAKRINEVLSLKVDQIDFVSREITFRQSKSRMVKETIITYPESLMKQLKLFIGERGGTVFVTNSHKPIDRQYVDIVFKKAGKRAELPKVMSAHVLRASAITALKAQGFSDSQIRQVSGHASGEMVAAYDKRSKAENITKLVSLV